MRHHAQSPKVLVWEGHLTEIPKAFETITDLQAKFCFERRTLGKGVSLEKGAPYPSVSLNFSGLQWPVGHKGRLMTEIQRCNGTSGCKPCGSVKYHKCDVRVHVVHHLEKSYIYVCGSHGENFQPSTGITKGLTAQVCTLPLLCLNL